VVELIKRKPRESPSGDFIPDSGTLQGSLELQSVVFAYPGRPTQQVLNGLSMMVSPGRWGRCAEGGRPAANQMYAYMHPGWDCTEGRWYTRFVLPHGQASP